MLSLLVIIFYNALYFVNGRIINNNNNIIFNTLILRVRLAVNIIVRGRAQLCLRQYAAHRHTCCTFAQRARIPVQSERDKYYNIYIQIREGM